MGDDKKFSKLVLAERDKGNVVYLALDAVLSSPVKEIVKQPVDGLLYDLNRDEATALTFMDREGMSHWVNNFAVALVIRELKAQIDALQELEKKSIAFYCGTITMHDWRNAVRNTPEAKRLALLAKEPG